MLATNTFYYQIITFIHYYYCVIECSSFFLSFFFLQFLYMYIYVCMYDMLCFLHSNNYKAFFLVCCHYHLILYFFSL